MKRLRGSCVLQWRWGTEHFRLTSTHCVHACSGVDGTQHVPLSCVNDEKFPASFLQFACMF